MSVTLTTVEENIAILRVNRPKVRNALDWDAMQTFNQCVDDAQNLPGLRALIVTGTKDIFIAGGDLKKLHAYTSHADGQRLSTEMSNALRRLEELPFPTLAAINGPARGGGVEIALACDLRVMATDADLGLVQVTLGLPPGWGAGQRLLRLVGYSRALEWLATGRILSAQEALDSGLANRLAGPGEAVQVAQELARQIARYPMNTVAAIKRLLRAGLSLQPEMAAAHEQAQFPSLWAANEHQQAVEKFLNRK